MGSITGIELGPHFCAMVAVRPRGQGPADVLALHTIERSEWPAGDSSVAESIGVVRRTRKFPRKARVVAWALPEGTTPDDPAAADVLRPLRAAGFRVDALLSPPQALAALAASRPRPGASGAVAWVAINVHGAAIAIVRGEERLFSRTLEWFYNAGALGTRAQLLQRYSLVAQLAPEIRRGIAEARLASGETVSTIITCGDLPELRSLTMPLIEELALEVETLDSTEGLQAAGRAKVERFAESAAAIRLACAAALFHTAPNRSLPVGWVRTAAAAVALAVLAWGVLAYRGRAPSDPHQQADVRRTTPAPSQSSRQTPPAPVHPEAAPPESRSAPAIEPPVQPPGGTAPATSSRVPVTPPTPVPQPAQGAATAAAPPRAPEASSSPTTQYERPSAAAPPPARARSSSRPEGQLAPDHETGTSGASSSPSGSPAAASGSVPDKMPGPAVRSPGRSPSRVRTEPRARPGELPLKEPLPRVDSILIDQDRRLAIVDGAVVKVGDPIGSWVVAQIDPDALILRQPSGVAVRIGLRSK